MKHFSKFHASNVFYTYSCNSEYANCKKGVFGQVVSSFARLFGESESKIMGALNAHLEYGRDAMFEKVNGFTLAELRVLADLSEFYFWIQSREAMEDLVYIASTKRNDSPTKSKEYRDLSRARKHMGDDAKAFVYHDLNTGESIVWTDIIC